MQKTKLKLFVLLVVFLLPTKLCNVFCAVHNDESTNICIMATHTQGTPRSSSIMASINGHTLSIVFLENLGQVQIEVQAVGAGEAQFQSTPTPDGVDFYITGTGSYIVYFNLSNGDVYYGEFEVTD